jgi:hypothetical protein
VCSQRHAARILFEELRQWFSNLAVAVVPLRFSQAFLTDFLADWEKNGMGAIKSVRMTDPATYTNAHKY